MDFGIADLTALTLAMSQVIREAGPWRRVLGFVVDGLRAEAARPQEKSTHASA